MFQHIFDVPVQPKNDPAFIDYGQFLDDLDTLQDNLNRTEFNASLKPTAETEQFSKEIANPTLIQDPNSGINYSVYQLNQDSSGTPLLLNLSWSVAAGLKPGVGELKAYASHLKNRPISVIEAEAHGKTDIPNRSWRKNATFATIAASRLSIINALGIDDFDIVGTSMGGVIAAKTAELAGDRAKNLVTISTVSFEKMQRLKFGIAFALKESAHQKHYYREATPEIQEEAGMGFVGSKKSIPTLMNFYYMMAKSEVPNAVLNLNPDTKWYDFVGSKEEVTDWRDHLAVLRQRNALIPRSSQLYILGSEKHSWTLHINAAAAAVAAVINQ